MVSPPLFLFSNLKSKKMTKLKDLSTVPYFTPAEDLAQLLKDRTQSSNAQFFRVLVSHALCKVTSMMRVSIETHDRGFIPVNMYAINLAPSGMGKGLSTNILEEYVTKSFKDRFYSDVYPDVTDVALANLAASRARRKGVNPDSELTKIQTEFERLGPTIPYSFDSATTPAVKQLRQKMLMCDIGSINLEMDEIGSNLLSNTEVLTAFLELYDVGKIKQKLTKNTAENLRSEEIDGATPTNLLLFGTPDKLLNGSKVEEEFMSFLETGYGRRCLFGYTSETGKRVDLTPEEVYDILTNPSSVTGLSSISQRLEQLADPAYYDNKLQISRDNTLIYLAYKLDCERRAELLPEHENIRKAELQHRYFKALKLAGAYAFIDFSAEIKESHLYAAIRLVEESGENFTQILSRDKTYVKLAKYLCSIKHSVTPADLTEDLPFYRGSMSAKQELYQLASAWAYKNGMVLKSEMIDGIQFFSGVSLEVTDVNKLVISHSTQLAENYQPDFAPFNQITSLFTMSNYNWTNHHFLNNYRQEDNAINGFNMLVLDVDEGSTIEQAQAILKDYSYHIYTTKRHDPNKGHRFRIVLPLSHKLYMNREEYTQFMRNFAEWFPLALDEGTFQRCKKWLTNDKAQIFSNEGKLTDALLFIPKSTKSDRLKTVIADQASLNAMERWFMQNTNEGNRNNQLFKYASLLIDAGFDQKQIENSVLELNSKLPNPVDELELHKSVFVTVTKRVMERDNG